MQVPGEVLNSTNTIPTPSKIDKTFLLYAFRPRPALMTTSATTLRKLATGVMILCCHWRANLTEFCPMASTRAGFAAKVSRARRGCRDIWRSTPGRSRSPASSAPTPAPGRTRWGDTRCQSTRSPRRSSTRWPERLSLGFSLMYYFDFMTHGSYFSRTWEINAFYYTRDNFFVLFQFL